MFDTQSSFIVIPFRVWNLPNITMKQLRFFETMHQFFHKGYKVFMSNKQLMQRTGIKSTQTIAAFFNYFEKHNIIKRIYDEDGQRIGIRLVIHDIAMTENPDHEGIDEPRGGGLDKSRGGS